MVYWGGGTVLSQTRLRFDQPDRVIDVKSHWCQPCEHIGVGVLAGSKDFSLLLGSMSSALAASSVNLFHSRFNLLSTAALIQCPATLNTYESIKV